MIGRTYKDTDITKYEDKISDAMVLYNVNHIYRYRRELEMQMEKERADGREEFSGGIQYGLNETERDLKLWEALMEKRDLKKYPRVPGVYKTPLWWKGDTPIQLCTICGVEIVEHPGTMCTKCKGQYKAIVNAVKGASRDVLDYFNDNFDDIDEREHLDYIEREEE